MNKYIILIIIFILVIIGGAIYKKYGVAEEDKPIITGQVRNVTITARKNRWTFEPEEFTAVQGDKIIMTVINEDDYDHGLAIDAFGVSQRIPAENTVKIEFVVTKVGTFPYYCSVPCGSGNVDGKKRGHFDQVGLMRVRSLISETK